MGISEADGVKPCQSPKENAPHKAGHYLSLVARGGIEPPTQGFSTLIDRQRDT